MNRGGGGGREEGNIIICGDHEARWVLGWGQGGRRGREKTFLAMGPIKGGRGVGEG